jgi:hypothetical protein
MDVIYSVFVKIIQKKLQEIPARVVNPIDGEKHHRK